MEKDDSISNKDSMYKGAPAEGFSRARALRKEMTRAEKLLWQELRNKKLKGFKFRRQHPISFYIVDFYCHKLKLVIEVDGLYHDNEEQQIKDKKRTAAIERHGLHIIRFTNEEVFTNLKGVLEKIELEIDMLP